MQGGAGLFLRHPLNSGSKGFRIFGFRARCQMLSVSVGHAPVRRLEWGGGGYSYGVRFERSAHLNCEPPKR